MMDQSKPDKGDMQLGNIGGVQTQLARDTLTNLNNACKDPLIPKGSVKRSYRP